MALILAELRDFFPIPETMSFEGSWTVRGPRLEYPCKSNKPLAATLLTSRSELSSDLMSTFSCVIDCDV